LGKGGDIAAVAPHDQIKLRNFEIPGCGGFTLSGKADNLDEYYVDGKEIATFSSLDDLIGKINYYLEYDEERKNIAEAGYKRTLKEHTYMHRFNEIFSTMGLETVKEEDLKKGTSRDIT
jgi:spore maturation protein CgeB